ncbi:MAG: DUF2716 domain-containing protein [Thermomicrobiales bacterium]
MDTWEKWVPFSDTNYEIMWGRFGERFCFRPSTQPDQWPGIDEPSPSITFWIGHVYDENERYSSFVTDLNTNTLKAFRTCVLPEQRLAVLDWHHACYWFYPHRTFDAGNPEAWPIPVLPNGDYYIFLAEDLSFGIFGHPWEQTICVFGAPLIRAITSDPPVLFDRPIRRDGEPIAGQRQYPDEAKSKWMRPAVWDEVNRRWVWADSTA